MYTAIYSIFVGLALIIRRRQEQFAFLMLIMIFLLLFMGGRYYVGCDFFGYLSRFENISPMTPITNALDVHEPGFELLITSVRIWGLSFVWVNILSSLIVLGCYWRFLRYQHFPLMILAVLFPIMIVQLSMSGIRQAIAVGFLMVASVSFLKNNRLMTAFWILVGAQFHISVIMTLPLAFLAGFRISLGRITLAATLLLPVALWLLADRIGLYQDRYVDEIYGDQSSGGAIIRYMLVAPPAVLFFIYRSKFAKAFPEHFELHKLMSLAILAISPLIFLSSFALHRINFYLIPFSIVIFIYVCRVIFTGTNEFIGKILPALTYGSYFVAWQLTSFHYGHCYADYQSYFF